MAMTTEVDELSWDIDTLVGGRGAAGVDELLDEARTKAEGLVKQKGKIATFDAGELASFVTELGAIRELLEKAGTYAQLAFSTDTQDPERGALLQRFEERATEVSTFLVFWELEWVAVPDDKAAELLADDRLAFARHYLTVQRRYRDHVLTEPEEKVLAEKSVTGRAAWIRLFSDQTSAIDVELDGDKVTLEDALSRLSHHDREVRATTAHAVTEALQPGIRTRAFIYNMLMQDKATDDRLRSYGNWLQSFNLSQEASDEAVQALVTAVKGRYDIGQRWYALKAQVLGVDKLAYYDRGANVIDDDEDTAWNEARDIVLDCYSAFSKDVGDIIKRFFDERWIDVMARPGKMPGAFCASAAASHHPYVMLNYTGKRRDVLVLAHELGHGLHQVLGNVQGPFHHETPLTVAETASVFGESIVFNRLLEQADSPRSRFALLAQKVEGSIATVFRQVAMNQFEDLVHNSRRDEGELSVDKLGDLWIQTQTEMLGDPVELDDEYRSWWSYIPHFIHVPGYVYSYAFGHLLATSVYGLYEQRGADFVPKYLEMLGAGGSRAPEELAQIVDCDLTDPSFWGTGLELIARDIELAEAAGREAGVLT
ncbi:MAG: oligoendopeptidase [Actinomycetota bacterium]|jgi:oligoendopeptidase F|nr:oligoendopeptidase [Actinomycetota bacterium]